MYNHRGNGYSRYDSPTTSSRAENRWESDRDGSEGNGSWRGNLDDQRRRADSRRSDDFQLGRDRAPMPVNDEFLVRYGAKRLRNGDLTDRDGYTLRTRDPYCRAPSPPRHNPGRDARRAETSRPESYAIRPESDDKEIEERMNKRARQQAEIMKRIREQANDAERNGKKREKPQKSPPKNDKKVAEDVEGEDEYEEDEPPPPKKPAENGTPSTSSKSTVHTQFMRKTLLPAPPLCTSSAATSSGPKPTNFNEKPQNGPPPRVTKQREWLQQYQQHVEALKERIYGPPSFGPGAPQSTGYFFQDKPTSSGPPSTSSGGYSNPQNYSNPPAASYADPFGVEAYRQNYSNPDGSAYSNPPSYSNPRATVPYQMPLPPPGVVGFEAPTTSSGSRYSETFGSWTRNHDSVERLAQQAPPPPPPLPKPAHQTSNFYSNPIDDSSDSEEDEAIRKLKEICRNYGSR
ncbi:hypothetical protein L3Y34_019628 [Caenorhabditis briggsae]|uniref:Uncharacterized protein n=2 Tax=Caenorhabditis briggsae TaxID=6238 RepID=A0AAE9IWC1_CAEBR|nr:hypothetical protein L3Y34_019628 [Caenorhabditis briggsae]